jgi:hypothetical protein
MAKIVNARTTAMPVELLGDPQSDVLADGGKKSTYTM